MKKHEIWEIHGTDMDGRSWPDYDEIEAIIEIDYDDAAEELLMEAYDGSWVVNSVKVGRKVLEKAAKKFGWKNCYWISHGADPISKEKIIKRKNRLEKELKILVDYLDGN